MLNPALFPLIALIGLILLFLIVAATVAIGYLESLDSL